jgi:hypothetical protein
MRTVKFFVLTVLVVVLVATPFALAGAKKGNLHGFGGGPGQVPQGFVKLKYDQAGAVHLFEVQIRKVPAGTWHVWVYDDARMTDTVLDPGFVDVGTIEIAADQGAGKFKLNAKRGDGWPLADADPAGADVEVRTPPDAAVDPDTVILEGAVPDPNEKKK